MTVARVTPEYPTDAIVEEIKQKLATPVERRGMPGTFGTHRMCSFDFLGTRMCCFDFLGTRIEAGDCKQEREQQQNTKNKRLDSGVSSWSRNSTRVEEQEDAEVEGLQKEELGEVVTV